MPVQQGSGFGKRFAKVNTALKEHSTKAPEVKFGDLPPGIRGGIAKLTECKFGIYDKGDNKGQFFFMGMGSVVEPSEGPNGEPIRGLFTSTSPMPCCETKTRDGTVTSELDNLKKVQDVLKLLGAAPESIDTAEGMESTAAALKQSPPYFRFSTSAGKVTDEYPTPRTWHNWQGVKGIENYVPPDVVGEAQQDNSPQAPETQSTPSANGEGFDLDALTTAADADDMGAKKKLTDLAKEAGVSENDVTGAENWAAVAELIQKASTKPSTPYVPVKDTICLYTPPGKRKAIECNIDIVDKKSNQATLLNNDDKKTLYKGVPWAEMSAV